MPNAWSPMMDQTTRRRMVLFGTYYYPSPKRSFLSRWLRMIQLAITYRGKSIYNPNNPNSFSL
jgi:hypothetical protein